MKLFVFLLIQIPLLSFGQLIKNAGFENWHVVPNTGGQEDPDFWESNNKTQDTIEGFGISKSTDARSGDYALKITPLKSTFKSAAITLGQMNLDTNGYWTNYQCHGDSVPYMPSVITGWYKYVSTADNNRKAHAVVTLRDQKCHFGGFISNAVGFESFFSYGVYWRFAIPFMSNVDTLYPADTLTITFFFDDFDTSAQGSYLLIDDLGVEGRLVTLEEENLPDKIQIFPNPFSDELHIENLGRLEIISSQITDESGQLILSQSNPETPWKTHHLKAGFYILKIETSEGVLYRKILKQ